MAKTRSKAQRRDVKDILKQKNDEIKSRRPVGKAIASNPKVQELVAEAVRGWAAGRYVFSWMVIAGLLEEEHGLSISPSTIKAYAKHHYPALVRKIDGET